MTEWDVLARAAAAVVAGSAIGLERAYRGRAAGMRTNALVAFGAALLVGIAEHAEWSVSAPGDPTRVIQGIVTGIGFLGAGVIIKEGFSVRGLTTAASVWVVAAIGVAFGAGLYRVGIAATVIAWLALEFLRRLENRVPVHALVHCEVGFLRQHAPDDAHVTDLVGRHGFRRPAWLSRHRNGITARARVATARIRDLDVVNRQRRGTRSRAHIARGAARRELPIDAHARLAATPSTSRRFWRDPVPSLRK